MLNYFLYAIFGAIILAIIYSQVRLMGEYPDRVTGIFSRWLRRGCDPVRLRNWRKRKSVPRLKPWPIGRKLKYAICVVIMGFCWFYQGERLPAYDVPTPAPVVATTPSAPVSTSIWDHLPDDGADFKPEWGYKGPSRLNGLYLTGHFVPMYLGEFMVSVTDPTFPDAAFRLEMLDHTMNMRWEMYKDGVVISTTPFNPNKNVIPKLD